MTEIQYVSDESGNPVGVIVPIDLWREIESEKETTYLLNSDAMRLRLLEAKERDEGISLEDARGKLGSCANAFEDLGKWVKEDRQKALRIITLINKIQREPFTGIGKPEPLKHELKGCWSRRIDQEHRLCRK